MLLTHRATGAAVVMALAACAGDGGQLRGPTVGGVVTYRYDVVLPPNAVLLVALADVTGSGADAPILAQDTITDLDRTPIAFELAYDSTMINPTHTYAVAARIVAGNDVLFVSGRSQPVITHEAPSRIELEVEPAGVMGPLPERAAEIAAKLSGLERIQGSWEDGDAASLLAAYFEDGALRYLEEQVTLGDYGSAANAYYFDEGALFYHETVQQFASPDVDRPGEMDEVVFRLQFGPDGQVMESLKWVNGEPASLEDAELRSTLRRASLLRNAAFELAASDPQ